MKLKIVHVEYMPPTIEPETLYISEKYGCAIHSCACGCGGKTVMSFKPFWENGWDKTEDENGVTFSPSIGNFQMVCKSHYYIRNSEVVWA